MNSFEDLGFEQTKLPYQFKHNMGVILIKVRDDEDIYTITDSITGETLVTHMLLKTKEELAWVLDRLEFEFNRTYGN